LNNNFESFKNIPLEKYGVIVGSFTLQHKSIIKGYEEMINVIESLPNNLRFHEHINHLKKLIYMKV
jgi:hypothetical protein